MAKTTAMPAQPASFVEVPSDNPNIKQYVTSAGSTFSEKMYQQYQEAKRVGFSGTYEDYMALRDWL